MSTLSIVKFPPTSPESQNVFSMRIVAVSFASGCSVSFAKIVNVFIPKFIPFKESKITVIVSEVPAATPLSAPVRVP